MARDLIRLSGFEPEVDIKIVPTRHEKIMVLKGIECDLALLNGKIDVLAHLAEEQDGGKVIMKLREIVLDYKAMGQIKAGRKVQGEMLNDKPNRDLDVTTTDATMICHDKPRPENPCRFGN